MKQVKFTKLSMQNFCIHIDLLDLEFPTGKLVMITGPNGSGKTSMIQALPFALYGTCEKGKGDDVLNDKVGKNCHVWVEFYIDDDKYRVDRYVKYTKFGNTVTICKNDGKPYKKGQKEVLPEIEKLLVPLKLFTNTLLFGQKVKTFFTDLKDSDQKEIFRKILKLGSYILYGQETSDRLKVILTEIQELEKQLAVDNGLLQDTAKEIQRCFEEKQSFEILKEEDINIIKESLVESEKKLDTENEVKKTFDEHDYDQQLETLNTDIGVLMEQHNTLHEKLDRSIDKIKSNGQSKDMEFQAKFNKSKEEITKDWREQTTKVKELVDDETQKIDSKINNIQEDIYKCNLKHAECVSEMKSIDSRIDDIKIDPELKTCPTCKQDIDESVIDVLEQKINKMLNERDEIQNKQKEETNKKIQLQTQTTELSNKKNKLLQKQTEELKLIEDHINKQLDESQERLTAALGKLMELVEKEKSKCMEQTASEGITLRDKLENLKAEKETVTNIIVNRDQNIQNIQSYELEVKSINESLQNKMSEEYNESTLVNSQLKRKSLLIALETTNQKKDELHEQIKLLEFWKVGFSPSGMQSMLIDEAIPFMNRKIAEYMDQLSNGRYTVTFDTLKETKGGEFRDKISVDVFDNNTHANSRIKLSGGQERIVDIGIIMTLCDLQSMIQDVEFNILMFDEIFDSLDDDNIGFVANLIKKVSQEKWVGIVSHRHIEQIEADDILSFT